MKPIKKILVPVDFSRHSAEAVRFAADLSRRYEASLELLHVFQPMTYAVPESYVVPTPQQYNAITQGLQQQLAAAEAAARAAGGLGVHATLLQGGVISEILRFAKESGCDLIVLGTHGRTGVKHLLIGSVAENVVRTALCPVLTVRAEAQPSQH